MTTPVLTDHARQRCAEMGISTKVAKRVVQHPSMVYPAPLSHPPDRWMMHGHKHPEFLVITNHDRTEIITVLWKSEENLSREEGNRMAREARGG